MFIIPLLVDRGDPAVAAARAVGPLALHRPSRDKMRRALERERMLRRPGGAGEAVAAGRDRGRAAASPTTRDGRRSSSTARSIAAARAAGPAHRRSSVGRSARARQPRRAVLLRHRVHRRRPHHRADLDRRGRRGRPRILRGVHRIRSGAGRARGCAPTCCPSCRRRRRSCGARAAQIRADLEEFFGVDGDEPIELWAWVGAYDHVVLCQLWGPMTGPAAGDPAVHPRAAAVLGGPRPPADCRRGRATRTTRWSTPATSCGGSS